MYCQSVPTWRHLDELLKTTWWNTSLVNAAKHTSSAPRSADSIVAQRAVSYRIWITHRSTRLNGQYRIVSYLDHRSTTLNVQYCIISGPPTGAPRSTDSIVSYLDIPPEHHDQRTVSYRIWTSHRSTTLNGQYRIISGPPE